MKSTRLLHKFLPVLCLLALPATVHAQRPSYTLVPPPTPPPSTVPPPFVPPPDPPMQIQDYTYTISDGAVTIARYTGAGGDVIIPATIKGLPVTIIGEFAFHTQSYLTGVTIPDSVTEIGSSAFESCRNLTSVTIPASVTSIGSSPFARCSSLTTITVDAANPAYSSLDGVLFDKSQNTLIQFPDDTAVAYAIPDSVIIIGEAAFDSCSNLTSVTIPGSVTEIGSRAFRGCSGLTIVTMPDGVRIIGEEAFEGCSNLTGVTLPDSVTEIGSRAFEGCSSLTSATIPESVTSIGEDAFGQCSSLTSVTIPGSVTEIENYTFENCSRLTSVTIRGGVTRIGSRAFFGCSSLTGVTIPGSVTEIGWGAFEGCTSLTNATIPESVTSIGQEAFGSCSSLTGISVNTANPAYSSRDGVLFKKNQAALLQYPEGKAGSYAIPDSVIIVGEAAFRNCCNLTSVTIPDGVRIIGEAAFFGCSNLTAVTIPDSVIEIENYTFENCSSLTSVAIPGGVTRIGVLAFFGCSSLTGLTIPDSVTIIESRAFEGCSSLTSVTIPDSLTELESRAFDSCSSLTSVTIPQSVTSIGESAFGGCSSLTAIAVDAANPAYRSVDGVLFDKSQTTLIQYPGGKDGDYAIPGSVTSILDRTFDGCTSLTSVRIPGNVTDLFSDYAPFRQCTRLMEITVDADNPVYSSVDGVLFNKNKTRLIQYPGGKAGDYAIPDGVTKIEQNAFGSCPNLTGLTIPASVTHITSWGAPFHQCTSLMGITVDASNPNYSSVDGVLFNKSQTALLQYPGGKVGAYAVPDSVTRLPDFVFWGCTNLTSITIPASVESIGNESMFGPAVFVGCSSMEAITVDPDNPFFSSVDGVLFDKSQDSLFAYPGGRTGAYKVPASVTFINSYGFAECASLTSVTIPAGVTEIGWGAFEDCTSLTTVTFEGNAPDYWGDVFMDADKATVYYLAGTTGWGLTYGGRPTVMLNGSSDPLVGGMSLNGSEGWFLSEWFGIYYTDLAPWLFHAEHGFVYRDPGSSDESTYFYDDAMGAWWWTSENVYPFIYVFNPPMDNAGTDVGNAWLFYFEGSNAPRSFGVVTGPSEGQALFFDSWQDVASQQ